jgi:hypothetical protein
MAQTETASVAPEVTRLTAVSDVLLRVAQFYDQANQQSGRDIAVGDFDGSKVLISKNHVGYQITNTAPGGEKTIFTISTNPNNLQISYTDSGMQKIIVADLASAPPKTPHPADIAKIEALVQKLEVRMSQRAAESQALLDTAGQTHRAVLRGLPEAFRSGPFQIKTITDLEIRTHFVQSECLPINEAIIGINYQNDNVANYPKLNPTDPQGGYEHHPSKDEIKADFENAALGWKFHLNVAPENVFAVAEH